MERTFPNKDIPRNIIKGYLDKINTRRTKEVLDMGCGKKKICEMFTGDKRFNFTNYDMISDVDDIIECDISKLPNDDNSIDICIMSLCMLGRNNHEYIKEAHRVLENHGVLYISEPIKRWSSDENMSGDKLRKLIISTGFKITEEIKEKFLTYTCFKK
jgi:SAM-dependent methyltransferase